MVHEFRYFTRRSLRTAILNVWIVSDKGWKGAWTAQGFTRLWIKSFSKRGIKDKKKRLYIIRTGPMLTKKNNFNIFAMSWACTYNTSIKTCKGA